MLGKRFIATPVVALLGFGALVAGIRTAGASVPGPSVTNPGLCFGYPDAGGCKAHSGGTLTALAGSTRTVGATFTTTSAAAAGVYLGINANANAPLTQFPGDPSDYSVTNVTSAQTCAVTDPVVQYNSAQALIPTPADCAAAAGDQIVILVDNVVLPDQVGAITMTVSTQNDYTEVETNAVNLLDVPSPPTSPSASGGDHAVTVSWSPPDSDGGTTVTAYRVYCAIGTPSTADAPSASTTGEVTHRSISVTGHQKRTCVVTAVNAVGQSQPSDEVNAAPTSVPNPPTGVYALVYNQEIDVRWTRPSVRGGTPITHYLVYCSTTDPATVAPSNLCATMTGTAREAIIRHLTNLTPYYVVVVAQNAVGQSLPSAQVVATPSRPPSAPRAVHATPVSGGIALSWKAPKNDFGVPVQAYFATCADNPSLIAGVYTSTDADTTQAEIDGLTSGTLYYCGIVALNGAGQVGALSLEVTATPL